MSAELPRPVEIWWMSSVPGVQRGSVDPTPVSAIYGMPEVSGAGLTEERCKELGLDYEVGRADLALTPRGAIAGRGGLLKLIFLKRDRKLIGVHCIGDIASEIVGIARSTVSKLSTVGMPLGRDFKRI